MARFRVKFRYQGKVRTETISAVDFFSAAQSIRRTYGIPQDAILDNMEVPTNIIYNRDRKSWRQIEGSEKKYRRAK